MNNYENKGKPAQKGQHKKGNNQGQQQPGRQNSWERPNTNRPFQKD